MKDLTGSIYAFEELIKGNFLYVDKTEYLWKLIRPAKGIYFLARPRRFGKSLTLSTLKAIFQGKKDLFKGLAIYDKPYDWKPCAVIHLTMNGRRFDTLANMEDSLCEILLEQADSLNVELPRTNAVSMFQALIEKLKAQSQVVLLLDEYDKPLLDNIANPNIREYINLIRTFYSVIKDRTNDFRFVFVTGVTKFCHVSLFSDLNNLTDISLVADYATMLGYTQAEFEKNFQEWIQKTEAGQALPHGEFLARIKDWYDGYQFHAHAENVYNPVSLAAFFTRHGEFSNYWFSTGTPAFLLELAKRQNFDFEAAVRESVPEIAFSTFEVDNIDPLTLLFQTGYVTIKRTEEKFGRTWYFLDFPNREVSEAFSTYILNKYAQKTQSGVVKFTAEMATALLQDDLEKLHKTLEAFFAGIPYNVHKKNEYTFQAIFFALFRLLGVIIEAESCTNDGRIDAVVQTPKAIYLFEFKMGRDPTALDQIRQKAYFQKYLLDERPIHLIGVNFDAKKGTLIDWKTEP